MNPDLNNGPRLLGLGPKALHRLRTSLENQLGDGAAGFLQEAGYAAGDEVYDSFGVWLRETAGVGDPSDLDSQYLSETMSSFFNDLGWGHLEVEQLNASMLISSTDWAEADPGAAVSFPSCHLTTGMLADFLTRMAGETVAVMEVECRSRNDGRCSFLVGSPDTLQTVYENLRAGLDYKAILAG